LPTTLQHRFYDQLRLSPGNSPAATDQRLAAFAKSLPPGDREAFADFWDNLSADETGVIYAWLDGVK
jgi:hypothetical protein